MFPLQMCQHQARKPQSPKKMPRKKPRTSHGLPSRGVTSRCLARGSRRRCQTAVDVFYSARMTANIWKNMCLHRISQGCHSNTGNIYIIFRELWYALVVCSHGLWYFGIEARKHYPAFHAPCWHVETCWNLVKWSLADEICHWYPYFTSIARDSRFDLVITSINGNPAEDVTHGKPHFRPIPKSWGNRYKKRLGCVWSLECHAHLWERFCFNFQSSP